MTKLAFGLVGPLVLSIAATTVACQGDSANDTVVEMRANPSNSRADDMFNAARASGRMDEAPVLPDPPAADGDASIAWAEAGAAVATPPTPSTKPDTAPDAATPPPAAAGSAAPADPAGPPNRAEPPPSEADMWPADCDYKLAFAAHGATGTRDTTKYRVGPGTQELVTFIFTEQRTYPLPRDGSAADVVINSGDRLTTTCSYDNQTDQAITYGEFSEREMCAMMLWAWPAGRLHSAAGTASTPADVTCGQ